MLLFFLPSGRGQATLALAVLVSRSVGRSVTFSKCERFFFCFTQSGPTIRDRGLVNTALFIL